MCPLQRSQAALRYTVFHIVTRERLTSITSWPDDLPSGNQKRFWRDTVKRAGVLKVGSLIVSEIRLAAAGLAGLKISVFCPRSVLNAVEGDPKKAVLHKGRNGMQPRSGSRTLSHCCESVAIIAWPAELH